MKRILARLTSLTLAGLAAITTPAPGQLASGTSDTAFVLERAGVIPENLVYDTAGRRFIGGDLEADGLIEVRPDGSVRPFAGSSRVEGRVLGLKIDRARGLLWGVAFQRLPQAAGDSGNAPARSQVFAIALKEGRLVRRVDSPRDGRSHLFNDLVIGRNGAVYFTDSEAGAVWALEPGRDSLRLLHQAPPQRFAYPNGIAFLPEERGLLVAHWQGMVTIGLPAGPVTPVRAAHDTVVGRIDGLYPACGGYVGVQNMTTPSRVIAFDLRGTAVGSVRELERGRPDFRGPTTGAFVGDTLFYVANAQIGPFDPRNDGGTLAPVLVLKLPVTCGG
jgi:sugar lactone lactonase YvrE